MKLFFHMFLLLASLASPKALAQLHLESWDKLLQAAVEDGVVDYRQWQSNPMFEQLVTEIAVADTTGMKRREKLVFYINSYNILAAQGILNGGSPSSLLGRYRYFKRDKYTVAGNKINLYDLEHKLIRPLGEPRIHFAIVCASQSCPILRDEAYTLARLDAQLEHATRAFINDERRNRFLTDQEVAKVSKIFDWFAEDFRDAASTVEAYLAGYVEDAEAARQLRNGAMKLRYLEYDWNLNGTR